MQEWFDLITNRVEKSLLMELSKFDQLKKLSLRETAITDEGIKDLSKFITLIELNLKETNVTDVGLKHVAQLKNLKELNLRSTKITAEGVERLRGLLPNCKIEWEDSEN